MLNLERREGMKFRKQIHSLCSVSRETSSMEIHYSVSKGKRYNDFNP